MAHFLNLNGLQTLWDSIVAKIGSMISAKTATTAPPMDGTAAIGVSDKFAKEDHVHPSDTSKLDLAGGEMSGDIDMMDNQIKFRGGTYGAVFGQANGARVYPLATPTQDYDASTKKYVDDLAATKATFLDVGSTTTIRLYDNTTNKGQLDPLYKTKIRIGNTTIAAFRIPFGTNRNSNFIGTTLSSLLTLHCDLLSSENILSASGMCCIGGKRYAVGIQVAGQYLYFRGPVLNGSSTNITGTIANNDYIFVSYVGLIY